MNIALLEHLRDARGAFVPWPTLRLLWPEARHDLDELTEFGFTFELHPFEGVAFRAHPTRLCPDQIEWNLGTSRIGRQIAVWNRVASTNDLAARACSSRSNDGLVILAEEQTAGRGSHGRSWSAPRESSILMSVIIFPSGPLDDPAWLTCLAAVAVAEVVSETCKVDARIKWPNDVRINRCKIAGILVERNNGSVIGIGLNVNAAESDFPEELILQTTSMSRLSGRGFDRSEITKELLRRLDHWYLKGITDGPDSLDAPVRERSEHINRLVEVETSKGPVTGRLAAIEVGRGITLVAPDGILIRINGREVRALKEVESI